MKPKAFVAILKTFSNPLKDPATLVKAKELHANCAASYYEVGRSALTDDEFDLLEKRIKKADPKWKPPIGAPVQNKKLERELVVPCASLDKIQADNEKGLEKFLSGLTRGQNVRIEAKIDGASLLGYYPNGKISTLSTRGNGLLGKSVDGYIDPSTRDGYTTLSGLVPDLQTRMGHNFALRFEAAMNLKTYEKKFSQDFDSARVLSSAAFNRKTPNPEVVSSMDYVLTEGWMSTKDGKMKTLSAESLDELAKRMKIPRPQSKLLRADEITSQRLIQILEDFRKKPIYDLDGLVIRPENFYEVEKSPTGENPTSVKAFKVNDLDSALETTIEEIVWNVSSFGVIVPKARVTPIKFGKVTVTQAALHNVVWARDRGAGVGARVKVLRSGEIIPKIVHVLEPAKFALPSKAKFGDYEMQGPRLVLKSAETPQVRIKKIARMFGVLGLDSLGVGLAKKMVDAGFDTTAKVCRMTQEDFESLPSVKGSAAKFYAEIAKVRGGQFTAARLFLASGVSDAGIGDTQMKKLVRLCPEALKSSVVKQNVLQLSEFIGPAFASTFYFAWPKFREWMKEVRPKVAPLQAPTAPKKGKLTGQCFSWTGYRNTDEEAFITDNGGEIVSFGKRTTVLFYKPNGKASTKVEAAGAKAKQFAAWINTFKEKT